MLIKTKCGYKEVKSSFFRFTAIIFILFLVVFIAIRWKNNSLVMMEKAIRNAESTFTVKGKKGDTQLMSGVYLDKPEWFHVTGYTWRSYKDKTVYNICYNTYADNYEECYREYRALLDERVEHIKTKIYDGCEKREILRFIHDEIVLNFNYDESYSISDVYTMMKTGRGVCAAYTKLFMALCQEFGFEANYVSSVSMKHAWNTVKVDGKLLHVDCTWDDPIGGRPNYEYFLPTDKQIGRDHYNWRDVSYTYPQKQKGLFIALCISAILLIMAFGLMVGNIIKIKRNAENEADCPQNERGDQSI